MSSPADPRTTRPAQSDGLGIASIGVGVLAFMCCVGTFVPYIGILFLGGSFALALIGLLLGIIGRSQRNQAAQSTDLSNAGIGVNLAVLGLWVLYWLLIFAVIVIAVIGGLVAFVLLGQG